MKKIWLYSLLLMIPLYGFWIVPQNKAVKAQQEDVAVLQAETEDYQRKIKQLKDLDALLQNPIYDGVLERVPTTLEQEKLILILQKISESTGFIFESISFSRGENAALETSTLNANFTITGRADKFPDFLEAIEKSPRFMGLETFSYSIANINGIDVIDMSVPLYTFAQSNAN
ncbi:type 4a pilus biogenesis protein PilO [bacterium]|nr:type 4a pilus biogenesis protein PilO [bacterium]NCQ55295.1 type 4a pilus biogenesis protein PilO [Candidatus Parcubacteria bacterium]NCS67192.1 type 4a pilus biogenesis protein PilO [Candidatus Peregrinibacteria bacterium]NCS96818.1 type 4a pilus biogenesis protein PilO [bacterium]